MGYAGGVGPHSQLLTDGPTHSSFNKRSTASPPGHILKIIGHILSACTFRIHIIYHLTKPNISSMRQVCEHYKIVAYLKESAPVNDIHTMAATQIKLLESGAIRHLTYLIHADYHCANTALTQLVHLALGYAMACRPTTQSGIASSPTSVLCIMRTSKGGDANIQRQAGQA
jgi:hypothetical protein